MTSTWALDGDVPKVSGPGYLSRPVSCGVPVVSTVMWAVVWASVLPLSDCPPRSHSRNFSSPSYPLENVALRLLEEEASGPPCGPLLRSLGFMVSSSYRAGMPSLPTGPLITEVQLGIRHPT